MTKSPATTKVSLLASAIFLPASIALIVGRRPAKPINEVTTVSILSVVAPSINPSSP